MNRIATWLLPAAAFLRRSRARRAWIPSITVEFRSVMQPRRLLAGARPRSGMRDDHATGAPHRRDRDGRRHRADRGRWLRLPGRDRRARAYHARSWRSVARSCGLDTAGARRDGRALRRRSWPTSTGSRSSIRRSVPRGQHRQPIQGRDLWMVKISTQLNIDENEPEAAYDALHHAREPLRWRPRCCSWTSC